MTFKIQNQRRFRSLLGGLVFIPLLLTGLAYIEFWVTDEAGLLNSLLFLPLSIYYALPALISPETYFVTGLGVGPRGFGGILISIVLYSAIAYLISIISEKNSSKRKEK